MFHVKHSNRGRKVAKLWTSVITEEDRTIALFFTKGNGPLSKTEADELGPYLGLFSGTVQRYFSATGKVGLVLKAYEGDRVSQLEDSSERRRCILAFSFEVNDDDPIVEQGLTRLPLYRGNQRVHQEVYSLLAECAAYASDVIDGEFDTVGWKFSKAWTAISIRRYTGRWQITVVYNELPDDGSGESDPAESVPEEGA